MCLMTTEIKLTCFTQSTFLSRWKELIFFNLKILIQASFWKVFNFVNSQFQNAVVPTRVSSLNPLTCHINGFLNATWVI